MILKLCHISKSFGGVVAINDANLSLNEGEIFALIGPNGAGKTTLFNIITGNYKPTKGEVIFNGKKIHKLKAHQIVHLGIARTFQNIRLFSSMTVLENVLIGFNKSLSYGQQRKVELARAMATNPRLLLLDEPAAGMNASESDELASLILKLRAEYKLTILLIEHDMHFVNSLCDRVLVLDYGKSIFEGRVSEAILNEDVVKAYLGDTLGEKNALR